MKTVRVVRKHHLSQNRKRVQSSIQDTYLMLLAAQLLNEKSSSTYVNGDDASGRLGPGCNLWLSGSPALLFRREGNMNQLWRLLMRGPVDGSAPVRNGRLEEQYSIIG